MRNLVSSLRWQERQTRRTASTQPKLVMAQHAIQSSKFDFQVEQVPSFMQLADGSFVKDGFTLNRRTDDNTVLGVVTDRYGLVQNTDLIGAAEEAFAKHGLNNFTRDVTVTGRGRKMYATYDFRDRTRKLAVGDVVGLRLFVRNSFDGVLTSSFQAGALRLACSNGNVAFEKEIGMTQKHGSKISVAFIQLGLGRAIAAFDRLADTFDKLAAVAITQAQGNAILSRLAESNVLSGKLQENIAEVWNNPRHKEDSARNLFNLYNAATQHLTHGVSGERFELANRVSANVLSAFDKAAKDPSRLAKLALPVELQVSEVALN